MKNLVGLFVGLSLLLSSVAAFAIETKQEQVAAFEAALSELKTHYGMIKFKGDNFGVTYDAVEAKYLRLINDATTLEEDAGLKPKVERKILPPDEFRQLLIGFAAEFKDGHTNILRQTANAWTLGIRAAAIDGRLFITGFNDDFFNPNSTPQKLEVGDEIVEIDGVPVQQLAKENALYMSLATEASRNIRALEMTINVPHRWLRARKTGAPVTVKFARHGDKPLTVTGRFHWSNTKDLADLAALNPYVNKDKDPKAAEKAKLKDKPYTYGEGSTVKTYFSEGLKKVGLPSGTVTEIGKLLNLSIAEEKKKKEAGLDHDKHLAELAPVERLTAYTVRFEGKTLGVLRVPSYSPEGGFEAAVNELRWLAAVIPTLEHTTDTLIIDQLSNGGGYVYEFSQFIRLFAKDGEMKTSKMDVKLSETFFKSHGDVVDPEKDPESPVENGVKRNFARVMLEKEALKKMREAYDRGEKWSGWVSFFGGAGELLPNEMGSVVALPGHVYTKPVLLLNDGRSASGGDFMPAAMQAAGRAVVMGETSMGLGGPVYRSQESMPGSEVFMRCTMGYCVRADGLPIENLGVVPEVKREISDADLKGGFKDYAHDVLSAAVKLADGKDARTIDADLRSTLEKRHTQPLSGAFKLASEMIQEFRSTSHQDLPAEKVAAEYQALFELLGQVDLSKISPEEWKRLELPLPAQLTARDLLLGSMTDRASVLNRLSEMKNVAAVKADRAALKLIDTLAQGLVKLGGVRFNGCMALLTKREL